MVRELNKKFGKQVLLVVPAGQATIAVREKIRTGKAPGLKSQADLFTDSLGHTRGDRHISLTRTEFSLLEMLIRLTSLQQSQQTSHLAIPDYILSFFLEETSTTGFKGEQRWRVRGETKKRVGFDPYTDTPTKDTPA